MQIYIIVYTMSAMEHSAEYPEGVLEELKQQLLSSSSYILSETDLSVLEKYLSKVYVLIQDYLNACRLLDEEYVNYVRVMTDIDRSYSQEGCHGPVMNNLKKSLCLRPNEELNNKIRIEKKQWDELWDELEILNTPVDPPSPTDNGWD